jgi:hypothetical protein
MLLTLGERRRVYSTVCFGGDTHLENLGVDGWILGERGPWTGFIWLRMGTLDRLLRGRHHKCGDCLV